ncbi:cyclic nucleotide-binding domain-containing protein [Streptomyces violaceus]|uniref:Crp/Fnr family transcriptional regulator n=1 Tax=Streptomyces violaceus TaxID=1936 RepID=UPI002E246731
MPYSSAEWHARSLLGAVSPEARGELLELGVPARFEAGKVLLSEGARDRHVLVLLSGFAKVTARVENGEESLLAVRVGGDSIGEMAAFDGAPRSATVTACGPLTARLVQPGPLHALLVRRPEVHLALTGIIAQRLRWANRRRLDFKGPVLAKVLSGATTYDTLLGARHRASRTLFAEELQVQHTCARMEYDVQRHRVEWDTTDRMRRLEQEHQRAQAERAAQERAELETRMGRIMRARGA